MQKKKKDFPLEKIKRKKVLAVSRRQALSYAVIENGGYTWQTHSKEMYYE